MRINYEAFIVSALKGQGFSAYADVPDGKVAVKPSEFVTVEMTGSDTNGIAIGTITVAVQSWAKTHYQASELASKVDEAIFDLVNNENPITHIHRNGLYNFPTSQMEPRYQAVYEMTVHIDSN